MRTTLPLLLGLTLAALAGCTTGQDRIAEHATEFTALDASTQQKIRDGIVEPGFTKTQVYMARGKPTRVETDGTGNEIWIYVREPLTGPNETISGGHITKREYDPAKRAYDVSVTPVDSKAFPHLVPTTTRVLMTNGRVASVENRRGDGSGHRATTVAH